MCLFLSLSLAPHWRKEGVVFVFSPTGARHNQMLAGGEKPLLTTANKNKSALPPLTGWAPHLTHPSLLQPLLHPPPQHHPLLTPELHCVCGLVLLLLRGFWFLSLLLSRPKRRRVEGTREGGELEGWGGRSRGWGFSKKKKLLLLLSQAQSPSQGSGLEGGGRNSAAFPPPPSIQGWSGIELVSCPFKNRNKRCPPSATASLFIISCCCCWGLSAWGGGGFG